MRRGTRVGQAYVAITADGSGINDDIADAFDDVDFGDIGKNHGAKYREGLRKHLSHLDSEFGQLLKGKGVDQWGNKISSKLAKAIESDRTIDKSINKTLNKAFKRGDLDDLMEHVGRKAGVEMGSGFDKTLRAEVRASLTNALKDAARQGEGLNLNSILYGKAGAKGGKGQELVLFGPALTEAVKRVKTAHKKMEADVARSLAERERMEEQSRKANLRFSERFFKARSGLVQKSLANDERLRESAAKSEARLREQQQKLFDRLAKEAEDGERKGYEARTQFVEKFLSRRAALLQTSLANEARLQEIADRAAAKAQEKAAKAQEKLLRVQQRAHFNRLRDEHREEQKRLRVSGNDRGIGDIIGRMTGKGSRNNFLNLFGRTMGGIVGLVEKAGKFATGFADGMKQAGDNASLLQKVMAGFKGGGAASGLTGMLSKLAAAWPAVLIGLGAIALAASVLTSVIGGLIGILVALASTIASALVGVLLVLGPLIGSVIASVGLLTAAFTSMTNAQRDHFFGAFKEFKEGLTGLGQIIMTEFTRPIYGGQSAIQVWASNMLNALKPVSAVATSTAGAFARAGNIITASLNGPGFKMFYAALGRDLPAIVLNLSKALGATLNGIGAMFAALLPHVRDFSRWLKESAREFKEWATSAKGQNSIKDFAERAVESIKSLWGFLKEFGGFIKDVLFSEDAQDAGNSIFGSMESAFKRFRRAIKDGRLEQWFEDAIAFAKDLGAVMEDLWGVFSDLYDSGVLQATGDAFKSISGFMEDVSSAAEPLLPLFEVALPFALGVALGPLTLVAKAIEAIGAAADAVEGKIDSLNAKLGAGLRAGIFTITGGKWNMTGPSAKENDSPAPVQGPPAMQGPPAPQPRRRPRLDPRMVARVNKRGETSVEDLVKSGNKALWNTDKEYGGYLDGKGGKDDGSGGSSSGASGASGAKKKKKVVMGGMVDFSEYAKALMSKASSVAQEIRKAADEAALSLREAMKDAEKRLSDLMTETGRDLVAGVVDAAKSTDPGSVTDSIRDMIERSTNAGLDARLNASETGKSMIAEAKREQQRFIDMAQSEVDAAAREYLDASTPKEKAAAKRRLDRAEKALRLAHKRGGALINEAEQKAHDLLKNADASLGRIQAATDILGAQAILNMGNVDALTNGLKVQNATLADYAEARRQVAERLAAATTQLADAISLRDTYRASVIDSIQSFGSILSAEAKTLNGIAQALTAGDITDNLRDRLGKIRAYHQNLRVLLAQGLSNDAYKQLVDAGVEGGGAYVDAILAGGQGSISEINGLVEQIGEEAGLLGAAASTKMYQAGVDAAQGLVDGLTSLSEELETAATALGNAIAQAVKDALGIASPSRVLMRDMDHVGDGAVIGLDNQHIKVSAAAARLAGQIAVSPEVAAYAAQQGAPATTPVSGNSDQRFRDLIVNTPTEDPHSVAMEVLNEVTGRL